MKWTLLFCFSLLVTLSFAQQAKERQFVLQEKGGSYVKVSSSGKLYVSGTDDFSYRLIHNKSERKKVTVVENNNGLRLNVDRLGNPIFTEVGQEFEISKGGEASNGFLMVHNGAYLAFDEGEFKWESSFNFTNAIWLRLKGSRAQPDRGGRAIGSRSDRSGGRSSGSGRVSNGGRSSSSRSSTTNSFSNNGGSSTATKEKKTATATPAPKPKPATGKATINFNCNRCNCSRYMVSLKHGNTVLSLGSSSIFNKNCQVIVPNLSPGYYQLEAKTISGGGDTADAGWVTIKVNRSGFSVRAGQTENISIQEVH